MSHCVIGLRWKILPRRTLKGMFPVKHKAPRIFNVVNIDGKQVGLLGAPKRAGPSIGKAIFVSKMQDPVVINASLAAPVGRSSMCIRVGSH